MSVPTIPRGIRLIIIIIGVFNSSAVIIQSVSVRITGARYCAVYYIVLLLSSEEIYDGLQSHRFVIVRPRRGFFFRVPVLFREPRHKKKKKPPAQLRRSAGGTIRWYTAGGWIFFPSPRSSCNFYIQQYKTLFSCGGKRLIRKRLTLNNAPHSCLSPLGLRPYPRDRNRRQSGRVRLFRRIVKRAGGIRGIRLRM